jgi:hypothetical protein
MIRDEEGTGASLEGMTIRLRVPVFSEGSDGATPGDPQMPSVSGRYAG